MTRYRLFDTSQLILGRLDSRGHLLEAADCLPLPSSRTPAPCGPELSELARRLVQVRRHQRPIILFLGGHPIKLGLSRFLIDLIDRQFISHLASNGAALIHDFELALVGGTSEDVARWLQAGQFGLWQQTSRLNDLIRHAAANGEGLGEAVGRVIQEEHFPHRDLSLAAACWRNGIPLTCHVTIGADILHAHPNCDGAALGQTCYTDFLIFARSIQDLQDGAFLNLGSAVTGPEVFLKALSMARNLAHQQAQDINHFTTAVFDLLPLPSDWRMHNAVKDEPLYYYRPWKTLLVRSVADGGHSFYIQGDFRQTIPALWHHLLWAATDNHAHSSNQQPDPAIPQEPRPCN